MSSGHIERDARRVRALAAVSAGVLLAALGVTALRDHRRDFRAVQRRFPAGYAAQADIGGGIRERAACTGEVDRCLTCHLGIGRPEMAGADVPLPYRAHGPGIGGHRPERVGCSACHGGQGRVVDEVESHAHPVGGGQDPLMTEPHIQASCARCHLPGERPGQERLLEGATIYAALGCPVCHPVGGGGKGGWDFGPDLTAVGRQRPDDYETSILEPAANFAGSTMPSFRLALENEPRAMESLIIYLEALSLPQAPACAPVRRSEGLLGAPCAECHGGGGGASGGRMSHRCPYLLRQKDALRCGGCHPEAVPDAGAHGGYCPAITAHREACEVCHHRRGEGRSP